MSRHEAQHTPGALGAERRRIMAMVVGRDAILILICIVAGIVGAVLFSGFMASMVYDVSPVDSISTSATCALLGSVALDMSADKCILSA